MESPNQSGKKFLSNNSSYLLPTAPLSDPNLLFIQFGLIPFATFPSELLWPRPQGLFSQWPPLGEVKGKQMTVAGTQGLRPMGAAGSPWLDGGRPLQVASRTLVCTVAVMPAPPSMELLDVHTPLHHVPGKGTHGEGCVDIIGPFPTANDESLGFCDHSLN